MGTSLTGTKPKDTYDSLIKVTDNGPISGTAKYLSDGLGNDLPIAVSTSNVGIGTSSPANGLDVAVGATASAGIKISGTNSPRLLITETSGNVNATFTNDAAGCYIGTTSNHNFNLRHNSNVIATITSSGLTFNGDTAAANALDDYEEGTFTPTFTPASGSYGTLTYGTANGKYTKIGNRVDFSLRVSITAYSAGSASGLLQLGNLPFNCATGFVGSVSMSLVDDFAANRYPIKGFVNDTTNYILLRYMTAFNTNEGYVGATDITASTTLRVSGTYFTA